jgi:hypothetical protein
MNDLPQEKLNQLLATYSNQLCEEPQRCEALLRDTFPEYPRQVSLLVNALKQGIPPELMASHNKVPLEVTRSRLIRKLVDNLFVQEQAAEWVVNAWSEALGLGQPARPMTTMQSPELEGGTDAPAADSGYAPTVMRPGFKIQDPTPPQQTGQFGSGQAPTGIGNSGNYNNPANYTPATPNAAGSAAIAAPQTGPAPVWIWFCVYAVMMALYCGFWGLVGIGLLGAPAADYGIPESDKFLRGMAMLVFNGVGVILFVAAPFLPKKRWSWIYNLVMICFGFVSCCLPFSIGLLIFWIQPKTKAFYNMSTR